LSEGSLNSLWGCGGGGSEYEFGWAEAIEPARREKRERGLMMGDEG